MILLLSRKGRFVVPILVALATAGCSHRVIRVQRGEPVPRAARWTVLPFENHSDAPQAAERAEALVQTLLRARGVAPVPFVPKGENEIDSPDLATLTRSDQKRTEEALAWARDERLTYAVGGSVEEWRYKSGIDAEPAIGVSLRIIDVANNSVVWSASGADTGSTSDATSGTALRLLESLIYAIPVRER